jgi:alpha-N-acetylglucosaminidase
MWNQTEAFCGKPWLRCNIQSFGGAVHLGGNLEGNNAGLWAARRDPNCGRLVGLGFVNEALDVNPVVYDLMLEAAWRDAPVDLDAWIVDYARRRYGRENADAEAAWRLLHETVYQAPHRMRSALDRPPTLRPIGDAPYDNTPLAEAWRRLLLAADECGDIDAYRFDLVNVARQTLSNHAAALQRKVVEAHGAGDAKAMRAAADEFLQLLLDMDELLATRREFLLGRWLADARRWGDTDAERARLEWNARRVLTCWGSGGHTLDYARKEWSGMISDFYHERWRRRLDAEIAAISEERPLDVKALDKQLRQRDLDWSARRDSLPTEPRGDAIALARQLWRKYGSAFEH